MPFLEVVSNSSKYSKSYLARFGNTIEYAFPHLLLIKNWILTDAIPASSVQREPLFTDTSEGAHSVLTFTVLAYHLVQFTLINVWQKVCEHRYSCTFLFLISIFFRNEKLLSKTVDQDL